MDWLIIILGLVVIWRILAARRTMRQQEEIIQEEIKKILVIMSVEHNQDGVFAYNAKSGEFLAHGQTFTEMTENFKSRFPHKKGLIVANGTIEEVE